MEKVIMKHQEGNESFFGFDNIKDYCCTLFTSNNTPFISFISFIGALNGFITKYIYNTPEAVYALLTLILFDTFTGSLRAIKTGNFTSKRFARFLLILFSYMLLLAVSFNLAKATVLFIWLPSFLFFGFSSVLLISILENLSELKIIPKKFVDKIKKMIEGKLWN